MSLIPVNAPVVGEREREYVAQCLDSTWISSGGPFVREFEKRFAALCGAQYGITTTNGTTALHLALATLGIGEGDEVIIPALTIASCAFAVAYTGARPVLVDSDPVTGNMDPALLEAKITPRTRAIMPVHLYGHPAEMDAILEIARRHNLYVVEDAAEAHGATYHGRTVGGLGTLGCFSFYANKIVTTGEGGMVVTSDAALAERANRLHDLAHSKAKRFLHDDLGFNMRLTNLQAAIGLAQLERIDASIARKRTMAERYHQGLAHLSDLILPGEAKGVSSVFWMYSIRVRPTCPLSRDGLMAALRQEVDTRTFFEPMHRQPVFLERGWFLGERYPIAEELADTGFYLPSGLAITDEQIDTVCRALGDILA